MIDEKDLALMAVVDYEWLALYGARVLCKYTFLLVSKSVLCFHLVLSVERSVFATDKGGVIGNASSDLKALELQELEPYL
jgi:hypothetical protein